MEMATLPIRPTVRQALLGILARPAAGQIPGDHLHFDRDARVWRTHEAREPQRVDAVATLPECA
jgi:hypothetical protein